MKRFLMLALLLSAPPLLHVQSSATANPASTISPVEKISDAALLQTKIIEFARSLTGIRYKYASANPKTGFDCSGFIHYVFRNFQIAVPRSSAAFAKAGTTVDLKNAGPGDLILFTGTNPKIRNIGHIGMVVSDPGEPLRFIHSTSGKAYGVTESALNEKYRKRYMKVVRIIAPAES
ncbi:C40 family peptidase [Arcticibacter sp.]|uniref:C40 family peptidase n=1 Tax=Arcticibacter sp. TaxID=1872630 RepID=UPI00388F7BC8